MVDVRLKQLENTRDYRLDGRLLKRMWSLAKPFWTRRAAWPYWIAMATLLLLGPLGSLAFAYRTKVLGDMTNKIIARDAAAYWPLLVIFLCVMASSSIISVIMQLVQGRLSLRWRQWMTTSLLDSYLANRTYYHISQTGDLDNPDQRIQESAGVFTDVLTMFPRNILGQITSMAAGMSILATIDPRMMIVIFVYSVIHSVVLYFVYTPTIKQNFAMTVADADLRYGLVRVRDHAEPIAFYRGEAAERDGIVARLRVAVAKTMIVINYRAVVSSIGEAFELVWNSVPYLLLVPLFLSGHGTYGSIAEATFAALQVQQSLNFIVNNLPFVTDIAPQTVRLAEIRERSRLEGKRQTGTATVRLTRRTGPEISFDCVDLQTPGGERVLVRNLSLVLPHGESLLIVGQTGVGKSSLLRAVAGLWDRGHGTITVPTPAQCLFLPQRPYMIAGSLRTQLRYPHERPIADRDLEAILDRICLPGLAARYGGLDAVRDWEKLLSIGEQQRLSFGRVLVSRPDYVFLDEATSGMDYATEKCLYDLLTEIGCTYVSIGHRTSLFDHHARALRLLPDGAWQSESIAEAIAHDKAVLASGGRQPAEHVMPSV